MMKYHCDQCGQEIDPLANYCSICGSEIPKRTIMGNKKEEIVKNPIFCPNCKKENWNYSLFCSDCGDGIYKKPSTDFFQCPECGEKNNYKAIVCFNCTLSFEDWFHQTGSIAEKLGFKGNLRLQETMNEISYNFIIEKRIDIGRNRTNSVVIPSDLVSSNHCNIDVKVGKLTDLNSTNGTYVNRSNKKIDQIDLGRIDEFNIAGIFTFTVIQDENSFVFRLTAILEEEEGNKRSDGQALSKLRKEYFILLSGDTEFYIRKFDGELVPNRTREQEFYSIKYHDGFFYFTEDAEKTPGRLVQKEHYHFPDNWEVNLESRDISEISNDNKITA